MPDEIALLREILRDNVADDEEALIHIKASRELGVDLIEYCASRFDLGEALVMERSAQWAGLQYFPIVPNVESGRPILERLESMGEVRALRIPLLDRDVFYAAPRFATFIKLRLLHRILPELHSLIAIVPVSAIRSELARMAREPMMEAAQNRLLRRWPAAAGKLDAPKTARIVFVALLIAFLAALTLAPWLNAPLFVPVVSLVLLIPSAFRFFAAVSQTAPEPVPVRLEDHELPIYTVLLPLRDEANMVAMLAQSLRDIDYPPEKLDIIFVVEAQSRATINAVRRELVDPRFQLIEVPDALPRTKPKALNFALPMVRGDFLVIYDAEDIPDPDQLRLAASTFHASPQLMCLQAELVIDNASESLHAALFAGEYAGQFGLMLPLLAKLGLPIPLGGTSNHFRVSALMEIGGWDPFNVTEDADLGIRLARLGMRTGIIASQTREEAPITLRSWLKQRTRWMKGWMQTLIVHDRDWRSLLLDLGWVNFIAVHVYVGSMIASAALHTTFLISFTIAAATIRLPITPTWTDILLGVVFIAGYVGPAALLVVGLARLRRLDLLPMQLMLPFYWVMHGAATLLAAWELVVNPFAWSKTRHGQTQVKRSQPPVPVQAE